MKIKFNTLQIVKSHGSLPPEQMSKIPVVNPVSMALAYVLYSVFPVFLLVVFAIVFFATGENSPDQEVRFLLLGATMGLTALIGSPIFYFAVKTHYRVKKMATEGVKTNAGIQHTMEAIQTVGDAQPRLYLLCLSYQTDVGQFRVWVPVKKDLLEKYPAGSRIEIRYLPAEPEYVEILAD